MFCAQPIISYYLNLFDLIDIPFHFVIMSEDSSNPNCDSPVLNELTNSLNTSSTDTVYVKSYFRRRSKSVHLNPKHSLRPHLMDPATFKQVLNTQKENLAEVKERQRCNTSILHHKNEWKTFFSNKKKEEEQNLGLSGKQNKLIRTRLKWSSSNQSTT